MDSQWEPFMSKQTPQAKREYGTFIAAKAESLSYEEQAREWLRWGGPASYFNEEEGEGGMTIDPKFVCYDR